MAAKTPHYLKRTAIADSALNNGRFARLGVLTAKAIAVSVKIVPYTSSGSLRMGVFCRYTDTNNWLMLVCTGWIAVVGHSPTWALIKRSAGVETTLLSGKITTGGTGSYSTFRLVANSDGSCVAEIPGASGGPVFVTPPDPELASGSGKAVEGGGFGIYDAYTGSEAVTRYYDDFEATIPASSTSLYDAVIFANRDARLTTAGHFRRTSDNAAYGPVAYPGADLPRVPVSGPEGRPVEIALKPSRGEFGMFADSGLDKVSAQLAYRPCWSFVPE